MKKFCIEDIRINDIDFYKGIEYDASYCSYTKEFLITDAFNRTTDISSITLRNHFI